jgi:hypothetical protein
MVENANQIIAKMNNPLLPLIKPAGGTNNVKTSGVSVTTTELLLG